MSTKLSFRKLLAVVLTVTAGMFLLLGFAAGTPEQDLSKNHPKVREVIDVQELTTPVLMEDEEVLGTAVGQDDDGEIALHVYVNLDGKHVADTIRNLPRNFGRTRVTVVLTEPFRAMGGKPSTKVSHTARQTPPIKLGTSGGWGGDLANGYCCGGTLGSLIEINGTQHILSNYHVFESDIVKGGNGITAKTGDSVIQPGLIDVGCKVANAQAVATLEVDKSLPDSNVDASIAQVIPGMVDPSGYILKIGTISSSTVSAFLKQAVKKSGRTTGLSGSTISGLNATVSVAYENECAGGPAFTKTFTGQIIIGNRASKFLAGGDSGSLMVQDVATNPKAVGLLFAGSSSLAVANPINEVLSFFGATMVGN
jgi:hypothetical protein